jgi:hypothetical protein
MKAMMEFGSLALAEGALQTHHALIEMIVYTNIICTVLLYDTMHCHYFLKEKKNLTCMLA